MALPILHVFAGVCLMLTGVSTEDWTNRKNAATFTVTGDVFGFSCVSVCGGTGILRCELKANGECAKRYYVACNGKDRCRWEAVEASCEAARQDDCEKLGVARRTDTGATYRGIVPALRRFGSVRRRDLAGQLPYTKRAGMAVTSGNGHAYAFTDGELIESHYGKTTKQPIRDIIRFPFGLISELQNLKPFSGGSGSEQVQHTLPIQPSVAPQPVKYWNDYQYPSPGGYTPLGLPAMYQGYNQAFAYSQNPPYDYSMWGNQQRPFSPFTNFFDALGLEDPMLNLG